MLGLIKLLNNDTIIIEQQKNIKIMVQAMNYLKQQLDGRHKDVMEKL